MVCEFNKRNGNGEGKTPLKPPEIKREVVIPRSQPELDRRRSARREQPQQSKKKPNKS